MGMHRQTSAAARIYHIIYPCVAQPQGGVRAFTASRLPLRPERTVVTAAAKDGAAALHA